MRLIDADKLIKKIDGYTRTNNVEFNIACKYIIEVVKEQPTAFDVEKVVKHIEECNRMIEKDMEKKIDRELRIYYEGQLFIANEIIKLIKRGEIDE